MKLFICATRDIVSNIYGAPIVVNSLAGLIRQFADQCKGLAGGDPLVARHPEHFELYKLGTYDEETGEFTNDKSQIDVGSNYQKA